MIERFYMRNHLSFDEVDIEFGKGLVLFSGASGAGKSVLLNSILGAIGQKDTNAKLSEVTFNNKINLDEFGIETDEITIFRQIKKEKTRYFINNQTISKKVITKIGKMFINSLNPREIKEFDSNQLIAIFDLIIISKNKDYKNLLSSFQEKFKNYEALKRELNILQTEINELEKQEEFIKFEISKINNLAPKIGEYEELQLTKKRLSKKEKIENHIDSVEMFFDKYKTFSDIFFLMGFENEAEEIDLFFENLIARIEEIQDELSELNKIDIEQLLIRIENIAELKNRYGSIEGAIEYRKNKESELKHLEDLRKNRKTLLKKIDNIKKEILQLGEQLFDIRKKYISIFENGLNQYLELLNLGKTKITLEKLPENNFLKTGIETCKLFIENTEVFKLSYGEQNRVRLAILTLKTKFIKDEKGILFLDEIDANLSGDESMQVAKVLKELSKSYQIFAISHQPQLTSQADHHFLVYKEKRVSKVKKLVTDDERVQEIVRMVGGSDEVSNKKSQLYQFALKLIK